MRTRKQIGAVAAALVMAAAGCASNPLPANRAVSEESAITSGRGSYARARVASGGRVAGELVAVADGRVLILGDDGHLRTFTYGQLSELRLGVHDNFKGGMTAWVALGTLSTVSHGFLLIFSAPAWIVLGSTSTAVESHRGVFACEARPETGRPLSSCLETAARFARFPQGLPPGVGEEQLLGRAPVVPALPAPAPPPAPVPPPVQAPPAAPPPGLPAPYDSDA